MTFFRKSHLNFEKNVVFLNLIKWFFGRKNKKKPVFKVVFSFQTGFLHVKCGFLFRKSSFSRKNPLFFVVLGKKPLFENHKKMWFFSSKMTKTGFQSGF
jgi:hypothetical protein